MRIPILNRFLMALTLAISFLLATGCVTSVDGGNAVLATEKGRKEAIQAYIELALGYVQEGQTEQAKKPLLEALKLDASNADANAAMAYVFQMEGENASAEQYFKKALAADPKNARILNNYGGFLFQQGHYAQAKEMFLKASEDSFYSERSIVFENLGLVSLQLNETKEAEQYFQRALRLNGRERLRSVLALSNIYYAQGDYKDALRYYNGFLAAVDGRQSPQSLLLGIRLSKAVNDRVKMANYISQLEQLYPNSAEYKAYKAGDK